MRIWPHLSINEEYQRLGGKGSLGDLQMVYLSDYSDYGTLSDRLNSWLVRDLEADSTPDPDPAVDGNVISVDFEASLDLP